MPEFVLPDMACRKMKAARSIWQTVYIYGAAGFSKTIFIQQFLGKRRHIFLSSLGRRWDETAVPAPDTEKNTRHVVVIDDLQFLDADRQEVVRSFVRRPDIWLILVSRSPVPAWLMPEYINEGFMVLNESDLSLHGPEIAAYLDKMEVAYTEEDIATLEKTTQGNANALRYTALRMKEGLHTGPELHQRVGEDFMRYLQEHVMGEWDSDLLEFLLQISVVDEFTLKLAEMITANPSAMSLLQKAAETGNFLYQEGDVYRLRDYLLKALRERAAQVLGPEQIKAFAKNAGLYYEMRGETSRALQMYEYSESQDRIRELLLRNARKNPASGEYYELRRYYLGMDENEVAKSPVLMAARSMLHSILMEPEQSEFWYKRLSDFARASSGGAKREAQSRLAYLDIGLPHRGVKDVLTVMKSVFALLADGRLSLPEFSVTSYIPSTMSGGKDFCDWSLNDRMLAKTAGPIVERVLGTYGKGLVKIALGESLLEKGETLSEVLTLVSRGQMEAEGGGRIEMTFAAVGQRVRAALFQGDLREANSLLDSFEKAVLENGERKLLPNMEALRCRLSLYTGSPIHGEEWLKKAPDEDKEFNILERYRYLTKARVYLALGENFRALAMLEKLNQYAELYHRPYIHMETNLLGAVLRQRLGEDWRPHLAAGLEEAEKYRFVRLIAESGPAILPLLTEAPRDGPWFQRVLTETQMMAKLFPRYLRPTHGKLQDFSPTGRKILRLQAAGYTSSQIAYELDMKLDNVRYHIKENYRKLGADNKVDALAEAKSIGLIL